MPGLQLLLAVVDAITEIKPHPLPEVPPSQLIDQLASFISAANASEYGITHLGEGDHAMADIGRQSGDSAFQMVAAFGVTPWVDTPQLFVCGVSATAQRAERSAGFREFFGQQMVEGATVRQIPGKIPRLVRPGKSNGAGTRGHRMTGLWLAILSIQRLKRDRSKEFGSGMVENPPTVQRTPV